MTGRTLFCVACLLIVMWPTAGIASNDGKAGVNKADVIAYLKAIVPTDFNEKESAGDKAIREVVSSALATKTREAATLVRALIAVDPALLGKARLPDDQALAESVNAEQRVKLARACYAVVHGLTWQLKQKRGWDAGVKPTALLLAFAQHGCSAITRLEATDAYLQRAASGDIHCSPETALALWNALIETLCRREKPALPLLDRCAAAMKLVAVNLQTIGTRVRLSIGQLANPTPQTVKQDFLALQRDLMALTALYPDDMRKPLTARVERIAKIYLARIPRYVAAMKMMPAIRRAVDAVMATLQAGADPQASLAWMTADARKAAAETGPRRAWLGPKNIQPANVAWVQPRGTLGDAVKVRVVIDVAPKGRQVHGTARIARVWRCIQTPDGIRIAP